MLLVIASADVVLHGPFGRTKFVRSNQVTELPDDFATVALANGCATVSASVAERLKDVAEDTPPVPKNEVLSNEVTEGEVLEAIRQLLDDEDTDPSIFKLDGSPKVPYIKKLFADRDVSIINADLVYKLYAEATFERKAQEQGIVE